MSIKPLRFILLVALTFVLLAGCSRATLYNALLSEEGIRQRTNISYGPNPRHTLDVYHPEPMSKQHETVVIFIHGGAWNSGDKGMYYFVARSLVDRGYVVVLPNYRLHPDVKFPAFLEDTARAVAWTDRNLNNFVDQIENVYLVGHSAGAYNAAMVAYDERYLDAFDLSNETITGFIGLAGLYNFLPITDPTIKPVFKGMKPKKQTQPVEYVDASDPPGLLITGNADDRVDPQNSRDMHESLRRAGVLSHLLTLEGAGHVDAVLSLGPYFRDDYPTLDTIEEFIQSTRRTNNKSISSPH